MSCNDVALCLEGLCKSFGKIRAVDNLSLDVHRGEMVGFLGPNGAGKSTTLYMACRLVHPTAGKIEIFGHNVWKNYKEAIRYVGTMMETPSFYEYLSGRKNLQLISRLRSDSEEGQIDEILKRIGLFDRRNDKVRTYSLGMKQRLGLGMALIGQPRLLILDEPTNGLDPEGTREILSFLREKVVKDGLTVFISSHLLYEVQEYCDKVFVINHGSLIASGQVKEILAPYDNVVQVSFADRRPDTKSFEKVQSIQRVEALSDDSLEFALAGEDSFWLNNFLLGQGYKVSAITPKQKTLKEFFLSITGETNSANNGDTTFAQRDR